MLNNSGEEMTIRNKDKGLTKEAFQDIKKRLQAVKDDYPGVEIMAYDRNDDAVIFGHEFVDEFADK